MAEIGFVQKVAVQQSKAAELNELVKDIVNTITNIDESVDRLVMNGLHGDAMTAMVNTYDNNRTVIDDFVKRFNAVARAAHASATANQQLEESLKEAAMGTSAGN